MSPRRGRPAGLTINPDAVADRLEQLDRSQAWLAREATISASHLAEMLAGGKGATPEVVDRIAAVLGARAGTIFPQRVAFRVEVRQFISTNEAAAA